MRHAPSLPSIAFAALVALHAREARAQTAQPGEADRIARRQLLQQATDAQTAEHFEEALTLALRAEQIEATAGTRLLIAQLRSQLGQHVEALSSLELCLREVDNDHQTTARNRAAIRERCESLQRDERTHVGALTVTVPTDAPAGLRVRVNGAELLPALYGISRPVLTGEVVVIASVEGRESVTRRVSVAAGASERVEITVPRASIAQPGDAVERRVTAEPAGDVVPSRSSTQRTLAFVAGGVGLAMLGGAVASGLMFQSTADDYDQQRCADVDLTASCTDAYDRMQTLNTLQWIGYVGGGALLATGVVLFVAFPRTARRESAWRCGPGPGTAGVSCDVRF